jgi:hypothetical protein
MDDRIQFSSNYRDLSTDQGFQFEFVCDRCQNGYRSRFQPSVTGAVSGVLDAASSIFGGLFSQASNIGDRVHSAAWQRARDEALVKAIQEVRADFVQCPKCMSWVCRRQCWNQKKGLCKSCAPDIGVEMAAAQANKTVADIWNNAATSNEDAKMVAPEAFNETVHASCPECRTPLATNAKFCPECGAKIQKALHCTECGTLLTPGAKFCPECGTKTS